MEQALLAYGLLKETVPAIIIHHKNMNAMVHSLDSDLSFLDIVAGIRPRNTLAPNIVIICLDYLLQISIDQIKENGFILKKTRNRQYSIETMTDADNVDDLALLANVPAKAESLQHC